MRTKNIVKSDEADSGGKKKKTHNTHGCSYEEICGRDSPPTWGPSAFSKEKHPLQIMVQLASIIQTPEFSIIQMKDSATFNSKHVQYLHMRFKCPRG